MAQKRYYWLKLPKDFFRRHDIRFIKSMPDGRDYVLIYLMLLAESIPHGGLLRFSEALLYSEEMLAVVTDTDAGVLRRALKLFIRLNLVQILSDKTIRMTEIDSMTGSESPSAERMRRMRAKQSAKAMSDKETSGAGSGDGGNIREQETGSAGADTAGPEGPAPFAKPSDGQGFQSPSAGEVAAYCEARGNTVDARRFCDYYAARSWRVGKNPMTDWRAAVRRWETNTLPSANAKYSLQSPSKTMGFQHSPGEPGSPENAAHRQSPSRQNYAGAAGYRPADTRRSFSALAMDMDGQP